MYPWPFKHPAVRHGLSRSDGIFTLAIAKQTYRSTVVTSFW